MPSVGAFACQQYKKPLKGGKKVHCKGVQYHHSLPFCFPFPCLFFISKENKCVICLLKLVFFFGMVCAFSKTHLNSEICLRGYRFGTYYSWFVKFVKLDTLELRRVVYSNLTGLCICFLTQFLEKCFLMQAHVYFEIVSFVSLVTSS